MRKILISKGLSEKDSHQEYTEWSLWRLALSMFWRINLLMLAGLSILSFIRANFEIVR